MQRKDPTQARPEDPRPEILGRRGRRAATWALLSAICLVVAAEWAYRALESIDIVRVPSLGSRRPVVFVLGSSRVERGIDPRIVERELAAAGVADISAANVCRAGVDMAGLERTHVEEIEPVASGGELQGVVAVAIRWDALNDGEGGAMAAVPTRAEGGGAEGSSVGATTGTSIPVTRCLPRVSTI